MKHHFVRWILVLLIFPLLGACRSELYSQVSERDANEILATLYASGIEAHKHTKDRKAWSVEVAEGDLQEALQIIAARGLPRERFADTGEIFKKEGLISTPSEERIRFIYATSQELGRTLSEIDGVVSARVHPVIPANDPLATRIRPSSASVFIKHRRDADLQALAPTIRNLVMRSIEGLEYENISLTFVAAELPAGATDAAATSVTHPIRPRMGSVAAALGALFLSIGGLGYAWTQVGPKAMRLAISTRLRKAAR